MANSLGLIESKGLVALIEAADVILKNSPAKILGVNKLDNGFISMAVAGDFDYVSTAIESAVEAARRVGEIHSFTVIENPSAEVMNIFGNLFSNSMGSTFLVDAPQKNVKLDLQFTNESESIPETEKEKTITAASKKDVSASSIKKDNANDSQRKKSQKKLSNRKIEKQLPSTQKIDQVEQKIIESEEIKISEENLSTIERLRREALGTSQQKISKVQTKKPVSKISAEEVSSESDTSNTKVDFEMISKMNVHKLRHYAREFNEFPIKGREISRANRDELVRLFKKLV